MKVKGRFLKSLHVWASDKLSKIDLRGMDVLILRGSPNLIDIKKTVANVEKLYTLVSDLTETEDEIRKKMTKTVKNEINRAKREQTIIRIYSSEQLKSDRKILKDFDEVYINMFEQKSMQNSLNMEVIQPLIEQNALIVTVAYIDGQPMVYHSYIIYDDKVRFFKSCSEFRVKEKQLRNAIGRANKLLQWEDILYFKDRGFREYDWGGIFSYDCKNGIDEYKKSFGGKPRDDYSITFCISLKAKVIYTILKLFQRKRTKSSNAG